MVPCDDFEPVQRIAGSILTLKRSREGLEEVGVDFAEGAKLERRALCVPNSEAGGLGPGLPAQRGTTDKASS